MIRTDAEYRRALQRLAQEDETLRAQREHLAGLDLSGEEVERAMQPLLSFRAQLAEEVEAYTQMKRGDLGPLQSLTAIGRWLVGARIAPRAWNATRCSSVTALLDVCRSR